MSTLAFISAGLPLILLIKALVQEKICIQYVFDAINKICFAMDFVALGSLLDGQQKGLCFIPLGLQVVNFLVFQVLVKSMYEIRIDISFANAWMYFQFLWLFIVIK